MTLVVDASVAIKWIVPEEHEAAAEELLLADSSRVAPELLLVEVGNVLRRKMAAKELNLAQARDGLALVTAAIDRTVADAPLVGRALEIAAGLNHSIYDCLYLACAESEGTRLITADRRLAVKLNGSPYKNLVHVLGS